MSNGVTTDALRRHVRGDYFLRFSVRHREWLSELTHRYKSHMTLPQGPWTLPCYYQDFEDKEFAAFSSLLIDTGDGIERQLSWMRRTMGQHPRQWFDDRCFASLGLGLVADKKMDGGGVAQWQVSTLMDGLWRLMLRKDGDRCPTFSSAFYFLDFDKTIDGLLRSTGIGDEQVRLRLLKMMLCTEDGIGHHLWRTDERVSCPLTKDVKHFLKLWFPDAGRSFSADEVADLIGLGPDLLYCCFAWGELSRKLPLECRHYVEIYQRRYNNGEILDGRLWDGSRGLYTTVGRKILDAL